MKGRARLGFIVGLGILIMLAGIAGGIVLDRGLLYPGPVPRDAAGQFDLIIEGWNTVRATYVDQTATAPERLAYGALSGMVDSLGDVGHSRFLTPEMVRQEHRFQQGQLEGIGVEVRVREGHIVIVAPIDGSPAQRAGLRPGDIILKVDGQPVDGLNLIDVVRLILGPAGTSVTLTIQSPQGQPREVTLVRARIDIKSVSWQRLPDTSIAHLRLATFSRGTADQLKPALSDIQQQGLAGIVLDLRSNPGGLLDEAVAVASQFLKNSNVLLLKDIKGQVTPVPVQPGGLAVDTSLVVLINEGTASAGEIVAGALQDSQRARVIGETTFGTGTVLGEFDLRDGSALLLAIQEWLTPNGRTIWHQGLVPDVAVSLPADRQPLHPDAEQDMTAAQLEQSGDTQLLEALNLLTQTGGS